MATATALKTKLRRINRPLNLTMPDATRNALKIACVKSGVSISAFLTALANRELGVK